jgi:hypothetical protein
MNSQKVVCITTFLLLLLTFEGCGTESERRAPVGTSRSNGDDARFETMVLKLTREELRHIGIVELLQQPQSEQKYWAVAGARSENSGAQRDFSDLAASIGADWRLLGNLGGATWYVDKAHFFELRKKLLASNYEGIGIVPAPTPETHPGVLASELSNGAMHEQPVSDRPSHEANGQSSFSSWMKSVCTGSQEQIRGAVHALCLAFGAGDTRGQQNPWRHNEPEAKNLRSGLSRFVGKIHRGEASQDEFDEYCNAVEKLILSYPPNDPKRERHSTKELRLVLHLIAEQPYETLAAWRPKKERLQAKQQF